MLARARGMATGKDADLLTEGDEVAVFGLPGEAPDRVGIAGANTTFAGAINNSGAF